MEQTQTVLMQKCRPNVCVCECVCVSENIIIVSLRTCWANTFHSEYEIVKHSPVKSQMLLTRRLAQRFPSPIPRHIFHLFISSLFQDHREAHHYPRRQNVLPRRRNILK